MRKEDSCCSRHESGSKVTDTSLPELNLVLRRRHSADGPGITTSAGYNPPLKLRTARENVFPEFIKVCTEDSFRGLQCHQPHRRWAEKEQRACTSGTDDSRGGRLQQAKVRKGPGDYQEVYAFGTNKTMLHILPNSPAPSGRSRSAPARMSRWVKPGSTTSVPRGKYATVSQYRWKD